MSIYKKLFEAKKEIGKISKDSKNPFFKSNYLSLNGLIDAVEEVLEKHELILLQPIRDGKVSTMILDPFYEDAKNDRVVYSEIELPNITDPQKLGSAITYYRRYTLQSLLGLQAEDDDGNNAAKPIKVDIERLKTRLEACDTVEGLGKVYKSFTPTEQIAMKKITADIKSMIEKVNKSGLV